MNGHVFRQISCLMVAVCCLMLFFCGCSRSGQGAESLADKKEGAEGKYTSETMIAALESLSGTLSTQLETLGGSASEEKVNQLIARLSQSKLSNITEEQLSTIRSNQQQIKTLVLQGTDYATQLATILKSLEAGDTALTAQQMVQLERLMQEYDETIAGLITEVEGLKAQLVDGVDPKNLANYSVTDFIAMQNREIEALTMVNDFLREVLSILN
jgi:hypothetical protein